MPYIEGRVVHDADSHLMELGDCLDDYLSAADLARYRALPIYIWKIGDNQWAEGAKRQQADPAFRAKADAELMTRKNYVALGAYDAKDRPRALDLMGVASQIAFTTFCLGNFGLDDADIPLAYATADAHNRMMRDFCSVDRRLLATAYIPISDFERARTTAAAALKLGAKGFVIPSKVPKTHAPSHVALDPVWAMAEEARIPILFHVGGEEKLDPAYKENGLPPVKDFHGGDDNFTSVSYMPIPNSAMQTIATLIFDGVFDRFPRLKWGAIELGASWVPGWMRAMDSAAHAFIKNEERLQKLSARPSEIVRRQLRVTPYPHEDAGWIIRNAGEEVCLFSTDYPHVEGGRNPLKRFDESLGGLAPSAIDAFYAGNYIDLMGEGLAPELRRPKRVAAA